MSPALRSLRLLEVHETKDKWELIREALRVLKKGGTFTIQDLFLIKRYYGTSIELISAIKSWNIRAH
jgi:ubiquinone/menaquinone biosynthesis C-methylase UbiE